MKFNDIKEAFENIANAIRTKAGTTGTIKTSEMPAAIATIPSGGVTWEEAFSMTVYAPFAGTTAGYGATAEITNALTKGKLYKITATRSDGVSGVGIAIVPDWNNTMTAVFRDSIGMSILNAPDRMTCNSTISTNELIFVAPDLSFEYTVKKFFVGIMATDVAEGTSVTLKFEEATV